MHQGLSAASFTRAPLGQKSTTLRLRSRKRLQIAMLLFLFLNCWAAVDASQCPLLQSDDQLDPLATRRLDLHLISTAAVQH